MSAQIAVTPALSDLIESGITVELPFTISVAELA
jgi:hypothetical protein